MNLVPLALAAATLLPAGQEPSLRLVYDLGPTDPAEARAEFLEPLRLRAERAGMDPAALELDDSGRLVVSAAPARVESWTRLVERRGRLEFLAVAERGDLPAGVLDAERDALEALRQVWPDFDPALYRSARPEAAALRWALLEGDEGASLMPLLVEKDPARRFVTADLLGLAETADGAGWPALSGRVDRPEEFGDFTESLRDRMMAVVLDGEVLVAPVVVDRLPGEFVISLGTVRRQQPDELLPLMLAGELPRVPALVAVVGG